MKHRRIVVEGPLTYRMRRLVVAREGDVGLEIQTIPQLASRLAGGFCRPTSPSTEIENGESFVPVSCPRIPPRVRFALKCGVEAALRV
jgi:hypothetical protein